MTDFNWNAVQRLVEAKKQAMVRQMEAETKWRAEYEPVVRKVANETVRWTVAEVAKALLTEDEVEERLADALRERHAVVDPLASEIVATVRSVMSAIVAEIIDGPGEDSDAGPLRCVGGAVPTSTALSSTTLTGGGPV
ncbi:hypothetical protein ACPFL9_20380 [Paenarthrobacter sp. NyZ202]|uniref:hypothetical protein n=1 Tax=Paenarthrobacter sp. NyZ202 TaxID=3402689 RepID=UPI003CF317BF